MTPTWAYKWLAGAVGLLLVAFWLVHVGDSHGAARIQAQWDKERAQQLDAVNFANQRADAAEAKAKATQARIDNVLLPNLSAATDRAARANRLLFDALHPSAGEVPKVADQPGSAGSTGESTDNGRIDAAIARVEEATGKYLEACARDATRLSALQAEIVPQL